MTHRARRSKGQMHNKQPKRTKIVVPVPRQPEDRAFWTNWSV